MDFQEIQEAIEVKTAAWSVAPVAYDAAPAGSAVTTAQSNGDPWAALTIQHGGSATAGIGADPCPRRTGRIVIQVFTKDGTGSNKAHVLAASIAAHFEYWQSGGLSTQAASLSRVGPANGWYQVNVAVPFRAD